MKTTLLAAVTATATSLLAVAPAHAHHPGGPGNTSGAGPINTISATTLAQGRGVVGIVVDHTSLDPLSDAQLVEAVEHAHDHGDHAHVHSLDSITAVSINLAYGITDDLTIAVRLPHVRRKGIRAGHVHEGPPVEFEVHDEGGTSGIGDLSALAQWRFVKTPVGFEAALLAGIKAPTGRTKEANDDGEVLDAEFQPGSGSWDYMIGAALTQRIEAWSFDASSLYTFVTEGTQATDLGDRFNYGIAVSYRLLGAVAHAHEHVGGTDHHHDAGPAVDLVLELNGEWHAKQEGGGEKDDNSGGHVLYLAPGLRISQGAASGFVSVALPITNDLNGTQAEPDWRLVAGVSLGF